jgi:hypothetical protein
LCIVTAVFSFSALSSLKGAVVNPLVHVVLWRFMSIFSSSSFFRYLAEEARGGEGRGDRRRAAG